MKVTPADRANARAWCTTSELNLFLESFGPALAKLPDARLKKNVTLARSLRNKWWTRYEAQERRGRAAEGTPHGVKNERSRQKSELFDEVVARFVAEQERRSAPPPSAIKAPAKGPGKAAPKSTKPPAKSTAGKRTVNPTVQPSASPAARSLRTLPGQRTAAAARNTRIKVSGPTSHIRGHTIGRGWRDQARQDARNQRPAT